MTGIDMLHLWAPMDAFTVARMDEDAGWSLTRNTTPKCPKLPPMLRDGTGKVVFASKAWMNFDGPGSLRLDINTKGLRLAFNPSKALHPYELAPLDALPDVWAMVEGKARERGIELNREALRLSRVDLARQSVMDEPIRSYGSAYGMLSGPRMSKTAQYPDGFRIGNKGSQTVFYSKRDELVYTYKDSFGCPERLLRVEPKFLRHEDASRALQATYIPDLLRLTQSDIDQAYTGYLKQTVFKVSGPVQTRIPFPDLETAWHEQGGKLDKYLALLGVDQAMDIHGGIDGFMAFLSGMGLSRPTLWRYRKTVIKLMDQLVRLNNSTTTTGALYGELWSKFVA